MTATPTSYILGLPTPPPQPTPGCVICEALDQLRTQARADGNFSRVSDCNVRMRIHTHRKAIPR